ELARLSSAGKLIRAEGSGHMIHLERPDLVTRAIREVIQEARGRLLVNQRRKVLGPEHPDMLISMANLALAYEHLDRLEEARELLVETLATQQRLRGSEHESSLNLGDVYIHGVDFARAEQILSGSLVLRRKNVDDDHPETLRTLLNLGN